MSTSPSVTSKLGRTTKPRVFPTTLFFMALAGATCRGVFEILVGKTAAYALQVVLVGLFVAAILINGRPARARNFGRSAVLWWVFLLTALLSMFASLNATGIDYSAVYVGVMVLFMSLMLMLGQIDYSFSKTERIGPAVLIVTTALMSVALLQQFTGLSTFPGSDRGTFGAAALRPSSLTGSFLHYPITLALLAFALLGIWSVRRRWVYLLAAVAAMVCVVVSYSRSGIVLVGVGLLMAVLLSHRTSARVRLIAIMGTGGLLALMTLPIGGYVDRFLSIFDTQGAGNSTRISAWESVLQLWFDSPLLIGVHTGQYSNVTNNFSADGAAGVTESGLLQILVSFGVLGVIGFYGMLTITVVATPSSSPWYRAGMIAAMVQSLFYQSTEVLPFMATFALIPLIAKQMAHSAHLQAPAEGLHGDRGARRLSRGRERYSEGVVRAR